MGEEHGIIDCVTGEYVYNGAHTQFKSIVDGMWWTITTMTTVGYGDFVPLSILGKLIACIAAITGILIIAFPVAIIGSKFNNVHQEMTEERLKNKKLLYGEKQVNDNINDIK